MSLRGFYFFHPFFCYCNYAVWGSLIRNFVQSSDQDDTTTSSAAPSSPLASQAHRASDPLLEAFRSSGAFHASFKNRTKSGFVEKQVQLHMITLQ
ncbi:hypothetical protein L1887_12848 [Cichorium endivia]|nr:hypothetical protein L1887_12848 [Cichorium endivia]